MALMKKFGGKMFKLVKRTPYKREANACKNAYKGDYKVKVTKEHNAWHVWVRSK